MKLIAKLINFPADWIPAINAARGEQPFGDFVRDAIRAKLDAEISAMPAWGGRRQKRKPARKRVTG